MTTQHSPPQDRDAPTINGHRGELHLTLLKFARDLGVEIRLGCDVVGCFEGEGRAGIEILGGERVCSSYLFFLFNMQCI